MAHIDPRTEQLVLRIVYDGAPLSGKTTTIRALGAMFGSDVHSPGEAEGRTLWFDWMEYSGGTFDGRPIRCQVVTVPGQDALDDRRSALLRDADALIFVLDADPGRFEPSFARLDDVRAVVREDGRWPEVGVVVQANKSDLPRAVPLDEVRRRVSDPATMVIRASATEREGIREAFVFGVRLAIDRAHALQSAGKLEAPSAPEEDATTLLQRLRAAEAAPRTTNSITNAPTLARPAPVIEVSDDGDDATPESEESEEPRIESTTSPHRQANAPPSEPPRGLLHATAMRWLPMALRQFAPLVDFGSFRKREFSDTYQPRGLPRPREREPSQRSNGNDLVPSPLEHGNVSAQTSSPTAMVSAARKREAPTLPGDDVPGGCIWPPVRGRIHLRQAVEGGVEAFQEHDDALTGITRSGWRFRTADAQRFFDPSDARRALVDAARHRAKLDALLSPERCLVLTVSPHPTSHDDVTAGEVWQLWELVETRPSLADQIEDAISSGDESTVARELLRSARAWNEAWPRFATQGRAEWLELDQVALREGAVRHQAPLDDSAQPPSTEVSPVEASGDERHRAFRRAFSPTLEELRRTQVSIPRLITALEREASGSTELMPLSTPLVALAIGH